MRRKYFATALGNLHEVVAQAAELGGARGVTAGEGAPGAERRPSERLLEALDVALRARGLRTQWLPNQAFD